jgi:hypothetical protein
MKQQKRIGLNPTKIEQEKIKAIANALDLTKTGVIKEIMHSRITLDDLFQRAQTISINELDQNTLERNRKDMEEMNKAISETKLKSSGRGKISTTK